MKFRAPSPRHNCVPNQETQAGALHQNKPTMKRRATDSSSPRPRKRKRSSVEESNSFGLQIPDRQTSVGRIPSSLPAIPSFPGNWESQGIPGIEGIPFPFSSQFRERTPVTAFASAFLSVCFGFSSPSIPHHERRKRLGLPTTFR